MSRSFKKTLITGNVGGSDKPFKKYASRKYRHIIKNKIHTHWNELEDIILPNEKETSNAYESVKDGKNYFGNSDSEIVEKYKRK